MFGHDPEATWMSVMGALNQIIRYGEDDGGYFSAHRMSNSKVRYLYKVGQVQVAEDEIEQQEQALEQVMDTVGRLAQFVKDRFPMWKFDDEPVHNGQYTTIRADEVVDGDLIRLPGWEDFYECCGGARLGDGVVAIWWLGRPDGPLFAPTEVPADTEVEILA